MVALAKKSKKAPASPGLLKNSVVSRWGNSLGLRIPREAVERLKLRAGEEVQVELWDDSITIRPARRRRRKWTIEALLKNVRPAKKGGEFPWGPAAGKELF